MFKMMKREINTKVPASTSLIRPRVYSTIDSLLSISALSLSADFIDFIVPIMLEDCTPVEIKTTVRVTIFSIITWVGLYFMFCFAFAGFKN